MHALERGSHSRMDAEDHGLPFSNRFALESRPRRIGPLRLRPGRISYGLCGGMCYAALDYYHAGVPAPAMVTAPRWGTTMHRYLVRRQLDSWRCLLVPLRTLCWMALPDEAVARATLRRQLPRLLALLKRGEPAVILLVRVRLGDPTINHQVVVTGYDYERKGARVRLFLYDPNHRGEVTLDLNACPTDAALEASQSTGERVRGFFLLPYRPRTRRLPEPDTI